MDGEEKPEERNKAVGQTIEGGDEEIHGGRSWRFGTEIAFKPPRVENSRAIPS